MRVSVDQKPKSRLNSPTMRSVAKANIKPNPTTTILSDLCVWFFNSFPEIVSSSRLSADSNVSLDLRCSFFFNIPIFMMMGKK